MRWAKPSNGRVRERLIRLAPTADARQRSIDAVPLRRLGTKDELADLALFLCTEAASYMTGGVYLCDGGTSMRGSFQ